MNTAHGADMIMVHRNNNTLAKDFEQNLWAGNVACFNKSLFCFTSAKIYCQRYNAIQWNACLIADWSIKNNWLYTLKLNFC